MPMTWEGKKRFSSCILGTLFWKADLFKQSFRYSFSFNLQENYVCSDNVVHTCVDHMIGRSILLRQFKDSMEPALCAIVTRLRTRYRRGPDTEGHDRR